MKKKQFITFVTYISIFWCTAAYAESKSGLRVRGSIYSDIGLLQNITSRHSDRFYFTGMNVLSISMNNAKYQNSKIAGLFDLCLPYGKAKENYITALSNSLGCNDLINLYSTDNVLLFLDVRKFYLSLYLPFAYITMGRQIINFGKGFVFSPIDVFSVIELTDIHLRRSGSDIVSIHFPLSDLTGVDLISGLPNLDGQYSLALKLFSSIINFDVSFVTLYRDAGTKNKIKNEVLGGVTFKGDLGIGLYGELVGHYLIDEDETVIEIMSGIDYSIQNKWLFRIEYLIQSKNYQFSTWGTNNIFGSVHYTMNELTSISTNVIYNFQHEIVQGSVQWNYNILQNVYTTLYVNGIDKDPASLLQYALRVEVKF